MTQLLAPAVDAVIFDIDNVLVDTRKSYLEAVRRTVEIFLTHGSVPLFSQDGRKNMSLLLTEKDVCEFKMLGGFNDDWDCCYGLLVYLLHLPVKKRNMDELRKAMNLKAFSAKVKQRPLGVNGIVQMLGRTNAITIERIARIFQEIYLGKDLFLNLEKKKAVFWKKRGLIHKEKLIFRKSLLKKLNDHGVRLGIATGRSRFEALYALKHFDIIDYFDCLTTSDEVRKAEDEQRQSLRKPHPFSLIETAKKLGGDKSFLYVGDLPDDIFAATRARAEIDIRAVGFPWYAADTKSALDAIRKSGPDHILDKPSDLLRLAGIRR